MQDIKLNLKELKHKKASIKINGVNKGKYKSRGINDKKANLLLIRKDSYYY